MMFYSAHDVNLHEILTAFNMTSFDCTYELYTTGHTEKSRNCVHRPWFAASLILELYEDEKNEFFVKMSYDGDYMDLLGKSNVCSY
mmetsp:Transcript_6766/g.924  ORF Transcript_6766/g.924 Transcript_6766/m.924 type:complete len:86 (+) Transcript_6766:104-361(+)